MSRNVNVPFSWELKPGVSKVTHEEGSIGIKHFQAVNLPPPPCLSKSARFCIDELNGVLPRLSCSEKKGNNLNINNKKKKDPFVAAFRKCTDKIDGTCKTRNKKNMFILSCKYSCNVSRCNVKSVSVLEGRTERKKQG